MRKSIIKIQIYLFVFALALVSLSAQMKINLNDKMPISKDVKIGTLSNGMRYYIRANKKPEKRAELRLAINAGSILEEENQRGLAHFLEHMEFNGTKNFPKNDLVKYLQTIGMRFGGDLNAYTSFDETVYMLQIPTDNKDQFESGFQVIEDWAHNTLLADDEIDKERGVIMEEWRLGKGAGDRIRKIQLPIQYFGSRYKDRLPIGDSGVIRNFQYDVIKKFYKDWYRPDLMAVIAVGDFDVAQVEEIIKAKFSRIEPHQNPPKRVTFDMPMHKERLVNIATDKELTSSSVSVLFKKQFDLSKKGSYAEYKEDLTSMLASMMLNDRLKEIARKPDAPFMGAGGGRGGFTRTGEVFSMRASAKQNQIIPAYETMLVELFRAVQNGFTATELERAKTEYVSSLEASFKEKDKNESANFAREYVQNYLTNESISGIEHEFEVGKIFVKEITLNEVNKSLKESIENSSFVATATAPDKEGVQVPKENELLTSYDKVSAKKYEAYKDEADDKPLFSKKVKAGKVVAEKKIDKIDATEWTLSNGIKVVVKPTDFKDDEILISGNSPGGLSLVSDADYHCATFASGIVSQSGVAEFNKNTLDKKLTGKQVSVRVGIGGLSESVSGQSTVKDIETALQLINLYITSPRFDKEAYATMINNVKESLKNKGANPGQVFSDSMSVFMYQHHFRSLPFTEKELNTISLEKAEKIYKERFSNASDFTFVFLGNIKQEDLKPLVEKYLGSLPESKTKENWKDNGMRTLKKSDELKVFKGMEKQAQVSMAYTSEFPDNNNVERYKISALREIFTIKLIDSIREKRGGVYSIGAREGLTKLPYSEFKMSIGFGCDPDRVNELTLAIQDLVKSLQNELISDADLTRIKETQLREYEKNLKTNNYWFGAISGALSQNEDPTLFLQRKALIDNLTAKDIQDIAKKYLSDSRLVKGVLLPESYKK